MDTTADAYLYAGVRMMGDFYRSLGGARVCPNDRTVAVELATTAVLDGVRAQALAPEVLWPAIQETVAQHQARTATTGSRRASRRPSGSRRRPGRSS